MAARLISIFSVTAVLAVQCWAISTTEWRAKIQRARSSKEIEAVLTSLESAAKAEGLYTLAKAAESDREALSFERVNAYFKTLDKFSTPGPAADKTALRNIPLRDEDESAKDNWISRALNGMNEKAEQQPQKEEKEPEKPKQIRVPDTRPLFIVVAVIVGLAIIGFCAFAIARSERFGFRGKSKPKPASLLTDEEEIGTYDEWLHKADALEAEGRYREAIRCLYLAMLLRLDEARICRFDRYQTNWEHLHRILRSDAPKEVSYRGVTQVFDFAWYGQRPSSKSQCQEVRDQYTLLVKLLKEKKA